VFTGIVEELGTVVDLRSELESARLTVRAGSVLDDVGSGDSIAVNGCCLTVVTLERIEGVPGGVWAADVMRETLDRTTLGRLAEGDRVNLERAVTVQTRLGGHLVQGHVDGVGTVVRRNPSQHWEIVEIAVPPALARYVVEKGSITVDGVSLTVMTAGERSLTVSLIPETLARTTLSARAAGQHVNLEVDVLAKYVERLLAAGAYQSGVRP
jgi:riboflavin synthase